MFTARVASEPGGRAQSAPQGGKVGVQHPTFLTFTPPRREARDPTRTPECNANGDPRGGVIPARERWICSDATSRPIPGKRETGYTKSNPHGVSVTVYRPQGLRGLSRGRGLARAPT
eukprot:362353-Prymnesium_polylepis.4